MKYSCVCCKVKPGDVRLLLQTGRIEVQQTLADFHIRYLKKNKNRRMGSLSQSQGSQILMNESILLFSAVLKDKAGMRQGNYFFKPVLLLI